GDLVRANVMALDFERSDVFNIGTGVETDVNALFRLLRKHTGSEAEEAHG
ncbi:UDP-glucose 4-epimerase, partial [candidate division KSB1 bacterium]|nr:UDP-glucose 4-epimerase [candidate division KSB1 bacterium]NIR72438.1 UDP-glucose 4-epimerase [candidate division KSB1 bacterium]NIS23935.1 UDP-glucose 4-epimerase [candidate division KSB1 bacterium]NIT70852.1 UDP-glucose 4-epimerase [candidate division KSB1 bacterium]NIU24583.1 UDP-glucose 4-epimerase [candidate division KSB1 bacterium]